MAWLRQSSMQGRFFDCEIAVAVDWNILIGFSAIADILDTHEMEFNHRTHFNFAGIHADCWSF